MVRLEDRSEDNRSIEQEFYKWVDAQNRVGVSWAQVGGEEDDAPLMIILLADQTRVDDFRVHFSREYMHEFDTRVFIHDPKNIMPDIAHPATNEEKLQNEFIDWEVTAPGMYYATVCKTEDGQTVFLYCGDENTKKSFEQAFAPERLGNIHAEYHFQTPAYPENKSY